jgi:succinate-semialdehyde dehydrogenase/glutarate-semialdehyde dehydrogenase
VQLVASLCASVATRAPDAAAHCAFTPPMGWARAVSGLAARRGSGVGRVALGRVRAMATSALSERVSRPELVKSAAYINGAWSSPAAADQTFEVKDPASGAILGRVPDMDAAASEAAVAAAAAASGPWRSVPAKEKGAVLRRWHDLILANADDLAVIMTSECGKPLAESKGEVAYAASFVDFFAEEARRIEGSIFTPPGSTKRVLTMKQAVGPAAFITPWNFPAAMITRKAAPAIAAGCPIVALPAPTTPYTALAIAQLAHEAGMPAGLVNVITSSSARTPEVGRLLSTDKRIKKLSFTGSTAVGKLLMAQCATTVKRVSLELGGNAPFIVMQDADLDAAAAGAQRP